MVQSNVIILAGGIGTRLKHLLPDIPKPMAPINKFPFLYYILNDLNKQGVKNVILSVGYMHNQITSYFGNSFKDIQIAYSIENEPLGTGGAIMKALYGTNSPQSFILNGDTFFKINLSEMELKHKKNKASLSVAVKEMTNYERYGSVTITKDKITGFKEKQFNAKGFINGGTYLLNKETLFSLNLPGKFSFENDFLEKYYQELHCIAFKSNQYFIDIGIPDDYEKAKIDFINFNL